MDVRRKITTHDAVVASWRRNAERHDEQNYEFLRSMKRRDYGFDPDELAGELHEQVFQIVDCTRCANCCKTMVVELGQEDIERIARHLGMKDDQFIDTYLERDGQDDTYKTRCNPCPFLGDDDRCSIYNVRPTVCTDYPHTDKDGFTFRTMGIANNARGCPAVFWIVEEMRNEATKSRKSDRKKQM
jgi:hypothetical protein